MEYRHRDGTNLPPVDPPSTAGCVRARDGQTVTEDGERARDIARP
jgi:hypothetical protein